MLSIEPWAGWLSSSPFIIMVPLANITFFFCALLFHWISWRVCLGQVRYMLTALRNEIMFEHTVPPVCYLNLCLCAEFDFAVREKPSMFPTQVGSDHLTIMLIIDTMLIQSHLINTVTQVRSKSWEISHLGVLLVWGPGKVAWYQLATEIHVAEIKFRMDEPKRA